MTQRHRDTAGTGQKARSPRPGKRHQAPPPAAGPAGFRLTLPVAAALLGLVCLGAYWNSFRAAFLLDNQTIILKDPRLRSADWQSVWSIFTHHYWWPSLESHLFRPLTTLSYWFNYSVLGNREHPFGYHAVNLLLHWINAALVFSLVRTVTRRPWVALVAASLFASHPLTVEAVTNVVGRADLLASLSVVGGLLIYLRFLESTGRQAAACLAGLCATCLAGVFCKESAIVLPAVMLFHDVAFPAGRPSSGLAAARRFAARAWPAYLAIAPGVAALLWARWIMFRNSPLFGQFASDNPIAIAPLWTGLMTAVKVAGYYLALMAWPARLSCDYSYNQITLFGWSLASGQDPHAWVALAGLLGLAAVALVAWRCDRGLFFFLGFAAAAFLPVANVLVPIGTIMAERLMYLPLVGMAAAVSLTLAAAAQLVAGKAPVGARRGLEVALKVAVVAAVAALLVRTVARNEDWTSSQRLWASSAEAAPNSIKVIRALAAIAMESDPSGGRADEAVGIAMRGVRITEQAPLPLHHTPAALFADIGYYYSRKATLLAERGESARARDVFGQAVVMLERAKQIDREINRQGRERLMRRGLKPEDVHDTGTTVIYRNLGAAYLGLGDPGRAIEALSYMVHVQPLSFDAFFALATAEGAAAESERVRGNAQQASVHLERAAVNLIASILLNPDHDPSWQTLERVYSVLGPLPGAILPGDTPAGRRAFDLDHPVVQRHVRQACVELVRRLEEGGLTDDAARWRQRMVQDLRVPPELFAPSRRAVPDTR